MSTKSQLMPGSGFLLLVGYAMFLALLLSWVFDTSRIESTIALEDAGQNQLYRNRPAQALDYFQRSALVDTDKLHHILRYRDSLRLAIQSGNVEKADFFFNEIAVESPGLITSEEIAGLLEIQENAAAVVERVVRIAKVEAIDMQQTNQAVSDYIQSLDAENRPGFVQKLNQAYAIAAQVPSE